MKNIYIYLFIFSSFFYCYADTTNLFFFSEKQEKEKEYIALQGINISEILQMSSKITEGKPIVYWKAELINKKTITYEYINECSYYPAHDLIIYCNGYIKTGGMRTFHLNNPSTPQTAPVRGCYFADGACFEVPQLNLEKYPDRFFVLFMNWAVDLAKAYKELPLKEYQKLFDNPNLLLSPTLKSYKISSFDDEKIESDLNVMTNMGEGLSVFLSPTGEVNYMGYGLRNDKIKLPFTLTKDIISEVNITNNPDDNVWMVLRNRRNYLIFGRQGKILVYFKEIDLWKFYSIPFGYDLIESNGFLIFNFVGTYGKDRFGDPLDVYNRRKLCLNIKNGESHFMNTEIDSRIVYFDGKIKIVANETGFEISRNNKFVKFIYFPRAKYIEDFFFKIEKKKEKSSSEL